MDAKELFWQIVNCPWSNPSNECSTILAEQKGLPCRQVPEPWSGNLETASFLMVGANPAIDSDEYRRVNRKRETGFTEVFPSRTQDGKRWMNILPNGQSWTDDSVYDFFLGRFNDAECPGTKMKYVDIGEQNVSILKIDKHGRICYRNAQNGYWSAYCKYSCAIHRRANGDCANSPQLGHDIVVTDIVHCKGGGERGVPQAMMPCSSRHMQGIIECFARNNSKNPHSILVFGSDQRDRKVRAFIDFLKRYGKLSYIGTRGTFPHKESKDLPLEHITEWQLEVRDGIILQVFTNLPKPSAANRAKMAVHFLDTVITW